MTMITRRGEVSRLLQNDKPYSFIAKMGGEEKVLLRKVQEKLRKQLGDLPSNQVLMVKLLRDFLAAA